MKKIFLLLLLFVSPGFSQQIVGRKPLLGTQINWSHPLAQGLVRVWLFNEGSGNQVYDATNVQDSGSLINMSEDNWVPGDRGTVLLFKRASSQYVDLGSNLVLLDINKAFTLIIRFKPVDFFGNFDNTLCLFKMNDNGSIWGWTCFLYDNASYGDITFYATQGSSPALRVNFLEGRPIENVWHEIAFVYNGSGSPNSAASYSVYINGIKRAISSAAGASSGQNQNFIGRNQLSGNRYFDGPISNVSIYNRALKEQEVQSLYVNPYAIFEQPLYGRRLKAAVAGGASGPGRLPQIIKIESEKKFFVKDSLYASEGNRKQTVR